MSRGQIIKAQPCRNMARDLSGKRDNLTGSNNIVVLQRTLLGGLNMVGAEAGGREGFGGREAIFALRSWPQPWQFFNKNLLLPGYDPR
jgi:hypothetical protein